MSDKPRVHRNTTVFGSQANRNPSLGRGLPVSDVLGWSAPVPRGKPVKMPNDERPADRPFANEFGVPSARDEVKYFASGVRLGDREEVKHLLAARRYPRPEGQE